MHKLSSIIRLTASRRRITSTLVQCSAPLALCQWTAGLETKRERHERDRCVPTGFTPVEQRFDNCDERQRTASLSFFVIELRFLC